MQVNKDGSVVRVKVVNEAQEDQPVVKDLEDLLVPVDSGVKVVNAALQVLREPSVDPAQVENAEKEENKELLVCQAVQEH